MSRYPIQPKPVTNPESRPVRHQKALGGEASLHWVTARLPQGLLREIDGHAKRMGATRSDAIRDCLAIGIEAIREREGIPIGRVEELLAALEGVRLAVDLMGPPTFGMLRLLAHWATRDGSVKVNEDELLAEVRTSGADEWEQAVAEAGRDLPEGPDAGLQPERG